MTASLWDFSLGFYQDTATQAACLDWQDRLGGDVNVLLYHLFLASQGVILTPQDSARSDAAVARWRDEVVEPLRALRRRLKAVSLGPVPDRQERFRDEVKRLELGAEKVVQEVLDALPRPRGRQPDCAKAAEHNLAVLAASLGVAPEDPALAPLLARFRAISG
ncbi:TIGR02444 family protein [Salipiger marinus]|uniref:TIGR02444 family protein n=1 Tax=Salipiger marinus TaxID=555512 RepID=UPI002CCE332F|nr:TIGR02444 family protein [Salipiger manganoxidans]MEB3419156.1 TIGR02444 family protein [Salipiger manganoxidans]